MFLYPPRPERAIAPSLIELFESRGYIAQKKKNGTCTVVSIDASGNVSWYTRHGEAHKAWTPTNELTEHFSGFPDSVFVGELLHSKGGGVKDTLCMFDVLVSHGRPLTGWTYMDRYAKLSLGIPNTDRLRILENYTKDLRNLYDGLTDSLDEGIVLKDPNAVLRDCHRDKLNANWQVKCRRATPNYGF